MALLRTALLAIVSAHADCRQCTQGELSAYFLQKEETKRREAARMWRANYILLQHEIIVVLVIIFHGIFLQHGSIFVILILAVAVLEHQTVVIAVVVLLKLQAITVALPAIRRTADHQRAAV